MSLFDGVPTDFPLDIDLAKRPVSYRLRVDTIERVYVTVMFVVWLVFGGIGLPLLMMWLTAELGLSLATIRISAIVVGIGYVLGFGIWWFWSRINASFHTANIRISDGQVEVATRDLIRRNSWSMPIAEFEGVALLNLGTRMVNNDKIPVASVVLKHPDPARSVPVAINAAERIGKKTVARKAAQLGLPVLAGVGDDTGEAAYPPGTVFVNRYQSLKVRLVYWGFAAVGAMFIGGSLYQWHTGAIDPVWPALAVVFVIVVAAMHVYMMRYVVHLSLHDGQVWMRTAALVSPTHRIAPEQITELGHSQGRFQTSRHSIHTPWIKMRIDGYFLPFIVDMQADYVDERKLQQIRKGLRIKKK